MFGSRLVSGTSPIGSALSTFAWSFGGNVVPYSTTAVPASSVSHITVMPVRVTYCKYGSITKRGPSGAAEGASASARSASKCAAT